MIHFSENNINTECHCKKTSKTVLNIRSNIQIYWKGNLLFMILWFEITSSCCKNSWTWKPNWIKWCYWGVITSSTCAFKACSDDSVQYSHMFLCNSELVCFFSISGGTSVSSALECPPEESRSIVSLDTSQMVCNQSSVYLQ